MTSLYILLMEQGVLPFFLFYGGPSMHTMLRLSVEVWSNFEVLRHIQNLVVDIKHTQDQSLLNVTRGCMV